MLFDKKPNTTLIFSVLLAAYILLWFMVLYSGNTNSSALMHYNLHWGTWYYQSLFDTVSDDVALEYLKSGYLILSSYCAKIFGTQFWSFMYINLAGYFLCIVFAFFIGLELRGSMAAFACGAVTAALPPIAGLAQAYESTILEMAFVMGFMLFFIKFARNKGLYNLVPALICALAAVWMGTIVTFQALAMLHMALIMAAFSFVGSWERHEEGGGFVSMAVPWIGALLIGIAGTIFFFKLAQWGALVQYHFNELETYQASDGGSWIFDLPYYPLQLLFWFLNPISWIILGLGLVISFRDSRWYIPLAFCILAPTLILTPVKKLDAAYIMETAPPLCILVGLALERILTRDRKFAIIGAVLLLALTAGTFAQVFKGRNQDAPFYFKVLEERPEYYFLNSQGWSEPDEHLDRQSKCIARYCDEVAGKGEFCYPWILDHANFDGLRFRARLSLARPETFGFFPAGTIPYNNMGEPSLGSFHIFAIVLDDETAQQKTFSARVNTWKDRNPSKASLDRYTQVLNHTERFKFAGYGCGIAFYRYAFKDNN